MGTGGLKECELKGNIFHDGVFYIVFELKINMYVENQPASFQCQIRLADCSLEVAFHGGVVTWHWFPGKLWMQRELYKHNKEKITDRETSGQLWNLPTAGKWQYPLEQNTFYIQNYFSVPGKFTSLT